MKQKIVSILGIVFMISTFLTGCVSEEERKQAEEWRKQAAVNAVEYIEEKYGFKAEVTECETQKVSGLFGASLTSWSLVTMEYEDEEFGVLIHAGDTYMEDASDNYQKDEIQKAFAKEIEEYLEEQPKRLRMTLGANKDAQWENGDEFYDSYFHDYFNGENLSEVLLDYEVVCVAEIVGDTDIDSRHAINTNPLFDHENMCMLIVSYDSEEKMKKCNIPEMEDDSLEDNVYENAMYVSDALFIKYGEVIPYDISIGQCGDFYYMSVGADASEYTIESAPELYDASEWNGHGMKNAKAVEDVMYDVEGNPARKLYIYYPKDKYPKNPGIGKTPVRMASKHISEKTGEYAYDFAFHSDIIEEYEVRWIYNADCRDFSFRFLYDED